jgi:hypothetical protein
MQNDQCKMQSDRVAMVPYFAFDILHFAICIAFLPPYQAERNR